MTNVDFAKKLMEFNFWENRKVWDKAIVPLTDEQFITDTGYSWGTIQRECVHIMDGEWGWFHRMIGKEQAEKMTFDALVDRQIIRQKWDMIQKTWEGFMEVLDSEKFFQECKFVYRGENVKMETWNVIFHVVNHGTTHRSEILRMVADVDKPVEFDLSMMQYMSGVFRD